MGRRLDLDIDANTDIDMDIEIDRYQDKEIDILTKIERYDTKVGAIKL